MTPDIFSALLQDEKADVPLDDIPYAKFLRLSLQRDGDEIAVHLRYDPVHLGSPGRFHGGVVGATLEFAAMAELMWRTRGSEAEIAHLPKPISLTVDYMRAADMRDLYASATIRRRGRRVASLRAIAWQDAPEKPVAEAQLHFLIAK